MPAATESFQIAEIRRDGLDLCFGEVMRDRSHDRRVVRVGLILTPLLVPARQLPEDVVMELTRQTGKRVGALGIGPVTGRAWRNLGAGDSFFVDFFAGGHEFLWSASQ